MPVARMKVALCKSGYKKMPARGVTSLASIPTRAFPLEVISKIGCGSYEQREPTQCGTEIFEISPSWMTLLRSARLNSSLMPRPADWLL